ncbi:DUF4097 family beta strand repeat-containing protein [Lachnoclostridium phytofermentans]|uniref:DUF4097 domain-containing protein n=1 Tax=Lachnoclostridium phytofermentans (strain ATCC 700394 / DSM 18823 / ISDg) TaxID=357809 RepID=A9KSJ9_LACP7|nr:DUF4097 family beta strand repeat-containing protein [Lachnoclostridium phytofermentans]ABX43651.1 hypothetical protein Cphy_3297 [Lachnoclostridium phytofermentans ISDg]
MKQKKIWLLVSLFLILMLSGCQGKFYFTTDSERYTEDNMKYFGTVKEPIEEISTINVNTQYADFDIIASDGYYVEYSYYYVNEEPVISIIDGILTFNDSNMNQGGYSISLKKSNYFKLYIPASADFNKVNITVSSGNVSMGSFSAKDVKVENSYGDTIITSTAIDKLTTVASSGDLTIDRSAIGEANIKNSYGDIVIKNINEEDFFTKEYPDASITVELSSGSLKIDKLKTKELQFNNSYGDVKIDESTITSLKGKLSSGDATVEDSSVDKIDINNSYGKVNLHLIGKQEDYCLDITSKYGDVWVGKKKYDGSVLVDKGGTKRITLYLSSGSAKVTFQ